MEFSVSLLRALGVKVRGRPATKRNVPVLPSPSFIPQPNYLPYTEPILIIPRIVITSPSGEGDWGSLTTLSPSSSSHVFEDLELATPTSPPVNSPEDRIHLEQKVKNFPDDYQHPPSVVKAEEHPLKKIVVVSRDAPWSPKSVIAAAPLQRLPGSRGTPRGGSHPVNVPKRTNTPGTPPFEVQSKTRVGGVAQGASGGVGRVDINRGGNGEPVEKYGSVPITRSFPSYPAPTAPTEFSTWYSDLQSPADIEGSMADHSYIPFHRRTPAEYEPHRPEWSYSPSSAPPSIPELTFSPPGHFSSVFASRSESQFFSAFAPDPPRVTPIVASVSSPAENIRSTTTRPALPPRPPFSTTTSAPVPSSAAYAKADARRAAQIRLDALDSEMQRRSEKEKKGSVRGRTRGDSKERGHEIRRREIATSDNNAVGVKHQAVVQLEARLQEMKETWVTREREANFGAEGKRGLVGVERDDMTNSRAKL